MKYALAVLAIVVVAFLAIFFVSRPSGDNASTPPSATVTKLSDIDDRNLSVSVTILDNITGDDAYRAIRMTVDSSERKIEVLEGYNKNVVNSKSYANNQAAFETFTKALDNLGYLRKQTPAYSDYRGVCPFGNVYLYSYTGEDNKTNELWSDSCRSEDGSFAGSGPSIRRLFQAQFSDYRDFTRGVL